jgi:hypothetical protein
VGFAFCSGARASPRRTRAGVGRCACKPRSSGRRSHLGRALCRLAAGTDPASRADLGCSAASAAINATATATCGRSARSAHAPGSASRRRQLGRHRRAAGTSLGRASARGSSSARPSSSASTAAAGRRTFAASADLGISSGRGAASCSARSRGLGATAVAFVGRCAAGRAKARSCCDRLGSISSRPSTRVAAGAFVERAGSPLVLGCAQDRGAGGPGRAFLGSAICIARRDAGVVSTRAG